jgi:hypothetical protein
MKKGNLVGGIICLAIAGILAVANIMLPPERLMFQIGDANMPWVPPVILGIVGIVLLATAGQGQGEEQPEKPEMVIDPEKEALNKRLETIAWGLFLIMLGGFMFVPHEIIRGGWWSIGVGLIMLGLNAARYWKGLKMSGFTTVLGILSVIGGALDLAGLVKIEGAILLIVLGAYLLVKPWFDKQRLFGKAEEAD